MQQQSASAMISTNVDVRWCVRRSGIVSNNQMLKGLTAVLKTTFYPQYTFQSNATRSATTSHAHTRMIRGSRRVGVGLDRTITQSVNLYLRYRLKPEAFCNRIEAERACAQIQNQAHKKTLRSICKRRIPYIQWFWAYMHSNGLRPGKFKRFYIIVATRMSFEY